VILKTAEKWRNGETMGAAEDEATTGAGEEEE
jgi:hypothetical protein